MKSTKLFIALFAIFFIFFMLLLSCNPCKNIAKYERCFPVDSILIEKTVIQRDSFTFTEPDTLSMQLLFECDSNNNVLIRELNNTSSKGIDVKYIFKDNRLNLTAYVDSIAILNKLIETTKNKEIIRTNPLNEQIKSERDKLADKLNNRNKLIWVLIGLIILIVLAVKFLK